MGLRILIADLKDKTSLSVLERWDEYVRLTQNAREFLANVCHQSRQSFFAALVGLRELCAPRNETLGILFALSIDVGHVVD